MRFRLGSSLGWGYIPQNQGYFRSSAWDFPQGFSFCKEMQVESAARVCWLPFVVPLRNCQLWNHPERDRRWQWAVVKMGLLRVEGTLQLLLISKAGAWEAPSVHRLAEGAWSRRESICSQCSGRQHGDKNTITLPSSIQKKTYLWPFHRFS